MNKKQQNEIKKIKGLEEIIKKQCEIVGANYSKINFKKKNWFWDYEWTNEQQNEFIEWLTDYMKDNKEARNDLMQRPSSVKKILERFAREFVFNYGWKTKEIK